MNNCYMHKAILLSSLIFTVISNNYVLAEETDIVQKESIEVIGTTPSHGTGLPKDMIPFAIQSATSEDIDRSKSLALSDFLNRNLGSVVINEAIEIGKRYGTNDTPPFINGILDKISRQQAVKK